MKTCHQGEMLGSPTNKKGLSSSLIHLMEIFTVSSRGAPYRAANALLAEQFIEKLRLIRSFATFYE